MKINLVILIIFFTFPTLKVMYDCIFLNHPFDLLKFFSVYGSIFLITFAVVIYKVYNKKIK